MERLISFGVRRWRRIIDSYGYVDESGREVTGAGRPAEEEMR